ncbi:peptidase [Faecalispora anaeroviscerum]|uniref:peptidase n=1 Tax=Faecalispora anaeroviscerum TaxID=2991836 RepID=UPI0024BB869E|nr:peptidase [Faecalispora anaeroviscerum]
MKQIWALILTFLLLCGMLAPSVLAAEEPAAAADTIADTDSGSGTNSDISAGTAAPSDAGTVADGDEAAPVVTVTPSAITLTSFDEPDRTDAVAFAVGTSQKELSDWFADTVAGFTGYDADGNPYDLVSGAWSLDAVDTATAGVYYASAAPDLGTEYTLADGVSLPRQLCAVSIQTLGEPDINCCVAGRGFLRFPWILSAEQQEQLDEFAVWLRKDGGEWIQLSDGFLFTPGDLQLSQRILKYGSAYELKVTYPGGQTGVLSFQYDGELSILDYSGGDRDGGDAGGSGSGTGSQPPPTSPETPDSPNKSGDDDDSSPSESSPASPPVSDDTPSGQDPVTPTPTQTPDGSQSSKSPDNNSNSQVQTPVTEKPVTGIPAVPTESTVPAYSDPVPSHKTEETSPEPENHAVSQRLEESAEALPTTVPKTVSESQESTAVFESYSPEQTVISGLRLRDLCADGESVVFGSGGLTVSIPSSLLSALNVSDSDTLTVTLTQPEDRQILLAVEAAEAAVTELSGTVIRLRYTPQAENARTTVQNEAGEQIVNTAYEGGLLCFTVDKAGTYTILESSGIQEEKRALSSLLPVSGGLLLTAGGITYFRRRRHG